MSTEGWLCKAPLLSILLPWYGTTFTFTTKIYCYTRTNMPDSLHCTSCTPKTDLDCSFVYDFSKFTRNTTQKLSEESSLLLITNPSKMDDTHPLPDSLVIVARDVHAVEYQPSDDICVQIIRKFSFRCLFDAIQQLFSREEREEREDEDEDDEDDDSKKIYNYCAN